MRLLLLHGPNLDRLGTRDPAHYGTATLDDLVGAARQTARELGAELEAAQHDGEGELVGAVHAAAGSADGLIVNAGAVSHYGHALRDALELFDGPVIEVHLSNIHARERFRRTSVIAPACDGSVAGLGAAGYPLAVRAAVGVLASGP